MAIPSLSLLLLIEQKLAAVVVHRRTEQGFIQGLYDGIDQVIPLPELNAQLRLAEIYDGVEFLPEGEGQGANSGQLSAISKRGMCDEASLADSRRLIADSSRSLCRNHFVNRLCPARQHRQPIEPQRAAGARREARLQRRQQRLGQG